ncbi:MAG: carbon-nitrogen hydrolase family protein [bacterium]
MASWCLKVCVYPTRIAYRVALVAAILLSMLSGTASTQESEDEVNEKINLRVAAGQFRSEPNLDANLESIQRMMDEAAEREVDLIVFPEAGLTGYPPKDCKSLNYVNQKRTEKALKDVQQRAQALHLAVAIGAAWKDEDNVWRNRAFLIDENGEALGDYDKIQQTGHERKFFTDGKRLPTFQWRGLRVGMLICMDMRYCELWRLMRKENVQLMLHLASAAGSAEWKVPVLDGTMRYHAASNGYHIVSCNNAGPIPMMVSAIYNPDGLVLAKANYAVEELIVADIQIGKLKGFVDYAEEVYDLRRVTPE